MKIKTQDVLDYIIELQKTLEYDEMAESMPYFTCILEAVRVYKPEYLSSLTEEL